ncbi:PREDICTED: myotubularin-related protein 14 isoform X4 [Nanorana parkeri]|uniref:myotubularin-related protein 14 isoform X4 n=1 Tax=Nanorana parkeri TaxID=125878 RepID=UPI000854FAFE|nr:PREDICTED: myotubularin-related protein 14 isoform X4 [Nanorana parkeri]
MEESGRHNGLGELLEEFSRAQFRAKDVGPKVERIERRCLELFGKDYFYSIIQNPNGELCSNYPRQIVFLEYESTEEDKHMFESTMQVGKLQDLINRSKMARCRGRFVCPVILYKGKHICRSATLAGWGELYGRAGYNYIFSGGSDDAGADTEVADDDAAARNGDSQFDKVRGHDIKVLRYLSVRYICDLMVENKKVKFGVNVTSSEKVDKAQRYADFTLLSIPYPGCEFFKDYKERDYAAEGLVFNWKQDYVDAPLNIPPCLTRNLHIDWREYQSWDLVKQTQNYLRLLIHIINGDDSSGLLVHCISGWDRTPLFVSLLRLSLWADGMVHRSLEPAEILYLTIAYDWFLFGHMLADRLCKGEEIFFFCFNFLKHITSDEFSSLRKKRRKSSQPRDPGLLMEDFCALKPRDRGSNTSLSSDFSVITEDSSSAFGNSNYEAVDLMTFGAQSHAVWKKTHPSSPHTVLWNRTAEEHMLYPLGAEAKSSSSSSSNHSDIFMRAGSSPLEVPQPRLSATSERAAKLEAVKSIFLSAYNTAIGLKTVSPSPSGAISGLLEQFARGVGLRGPSAIV